MQSGQSIDLHSTATTHLNGTWLVAHMIQIDTDSKPALAIVPKVLSAEHAEPPHQTNERHYFKARYQSHVILLL